jgi:hypothetical protein
MKDNICVSCTWGVGPDVLVTFKNFPFILYENPKNDAPPKGQWAHGYVSKGAFDMNIDEAEKFAALLSEAAQSAREIEKGIKEHSATLSKDI